jgi:uncharacterized lipoprotein YmbA
MRNILRLSIRFGFVLFICMTVIGCMRSTPPVSFYTLTPVSSEQVMGTDQNSLKDISIGIGPAKFPQMLDRPQIITRPTANTLKLSEFDRWGGDLKQDFLNVLTQNVSIIAGSNQVFTFPWSDSFKPAYRVALDVHQFDGRLGESVLLNVSWVLKNTQADAGHSVFKKSVIKQAVAGNDYNALVKAKSEALKTLSQAIVDEIKQAGK